MYSTFIPADELTAHPDDGGWAIVDCRYVLPKLYPGSWSEWTAEGTRPVDMGGPA